MNQELKYNVGFGNHFATEARLGALPIGQNIPQKPALGLYPEQLTGTSFTAPRSENQRSWLYRTRPSVALNSKFELKPHKYVKMPPFRDTPPPPDPFRWLPTPIPEDPTDFIDGLRTMAGNGAVNSDGCVVHVYSCNKSMTESYFYNADGDFLFVPQEGMLKLHTEFGIIALKPLEIAVVQRGIKFRVEVAGPSRGYICENLGAPFQLPGLGPIGANGLANPRDFKIPVASFEDESGKFELRCKFHGNIWTSTVDHSPLNVVAWHGNYAPYKYDLRLFQTIGTISYDHPDPSIFTVLTSQTPRAGTASIDFVIFPPRWMVAENSFRPPYFHRNLMSEYMGLIHGVYDAKIGGGFIPGGSSLHNCMTPHGPDKSTFDKATEAELKPEYYKDTMAFMFESRSIFEPTPFALSCPELDLDYVKCWQGYTSQFKA